MLKFRPNVFFESTKLKNCFFILFFIIPINVNLAQNLYILSGHVFDKNTGEPLAFVDVFLKDGSTGDMSDEKGYYELYLKSGTYTIVASKIGFSPFIKKIGIEDSIRLDIYLEQHALSTPGITVVGIRPLRFDIRQTNEYQINAESVKYQPLNLNDIGRSFKTLPGISSNNAKRSDFNVWGGSTEENSLIVDGTRFYHPFHLREYGNSSISIINMDMVESASLLPGGFPVKYGNALSSVINLNLRKGSTQSISASLETGVIRTGLFFECPMFGKGSWLLNANVSSFNLAIDLMEKYKLAPKFYEVKNAPAFADLQGKFHYEINNNHQFSFNFIFANDKYKEEPTWNNQHFIYDFGDYFSHQNSQELKYIGKAVQKNNFLALRTQNNFCPSLKTDTKISYQKIHEDYNYNNIITGTSLFIDAIGEQIGNADIDYNHFVDSNLDLAIFGFETDLNWKLNYKNEIEIGYLFEKYNYLFSENEKLQNQVIGSITINDNTTAFNKADSLINEDYLNSFAIRHVVYFQNSWQISQQIESSIGVRSEYFSFNRNYHIAPRISVVYNMSSFMNIRLAFGKYFQNPKYYEFKELNPTKNNTKDKEAAHYIFSSNIRLNRHSLFKFDIFYKDYQNLISYFNQNWKPISSKLNDTKGFAKGFNTQFKYLYNNLSGWLSYGYLIARENNITDSIGYFPKNSDQTHTFSFLLNWELPSGWRFHGKMLYGSGFPDTPVLLNTNEGKLVRGEKNSVYLPYYQRIDVRVSKIFGFDWGNITTYFEIINLTNHKNILGYEDFELDEFGDLTRDELILLPRLPNIGIEIFFN